MSTTTNTTKALPALPAATTGITTPPSYTAPAATVSTTPVIRFGTAHATTALHPPHPAVPSSSYADVVAGSSGKKIEKANDDFSRTHEKDLEAGDLHHTKFDDTYKPTDSKLPDLSKSQKEWEGKSAHIMKWKKMDEAMRLAAKTGAVHMKGVPVSEAVNKVEHKCDTACEKECTMAGSCDKQLAADHIISEADILIIRRHDLVGEQAAAAGSMLQKAGWVTKAVGVEAATGVVNKTHTSGPSVMTKIGTQIRGVTSTMGEKFANAKDAVITAKDDLVEGITKDKSDEQKLKDINRPSTELESSITTTTTEQTKMERLTATATSVKDTMYDAGQRATPYLQKAAVAAGQVLKAAGAIAQPIMHHLAQGVAEVTAPAKQSDSLKEEISMNLKEVQKKEGKEGEIFDTTSVDTSDFDKTRLSTSDYEKTRQGSDSTWSASKGAYIPKETTVEQPGSFRTKPFEPAAHLAPSVPLASDTFTHEVKSRPSSPVHFDNTSSTIPFNTSTNVTSSNPFASDVSSHVGGAPLHGQANTWLPGQDKFHHGQSNIGVATTHYQQQLPIDNTKFSGNPVSGNFGTSMPSTGINTDYDLQVQNKNNLNLTNSNLTANQLQQLRHQQQGQHHQHAL